MSNVSSGLMEYVAKAVERHKGGPGGKKQKWAMRYLIGLALRQLDRQRVRITGKAFWSEAGESNAPGGVELGRAGVTL
jgi:hypothetical protein